MQSLREQLTAIVADAFTRCGYDSQYGDVTVSARPDLAQYQCNGALPAAKEYRTKPREIAQRVVNALAGHRAFRVVSIAGPGFINLTLTDDYLSTHVDHMASDARLGCPPVEAPRKIVVDYGGPNVAKPMHVGHLRAAIIGESVKRTARFMGHDVLGDVHLGDWGLQMGMLIAELTRRRPDLPYFDADNAGPYPAESPVTIDDLEEIYPAASQRAKTDPEAMDAAREATRELQNGRPGYRALWQHFHDVSVAGLRADYARLGVEFDLWLGESDTKDRIPALIDRLKREGHAVESEGALVIPVAKPDDTVEIPPLMLTKSDGAVLYGTTDLATIEQRVQELGAQLIVYVVDNRQAVHFRQVFRAAHETGVAPPSVELEHAGFGTMNGTDGKPFKTREGGVMKLNDLMEMVTRKAFERMAEAEVASEYSAEEKGRIAHLVGMAALKFADLSGHRTKDYVFDLERFSSFEGRTGPYLLYATVRTKSILRKAAAQQLEAGSIRVPSSDVERDLHLALVRLPDVIALAFEGRAPNQLAEYAYEVAAQFNRLYRDHHILNERDPEQRGSWLRLADMTARTLELLLQLLGIEVPDRM